jgi:single-stranded DNA-binding protein
MNTQTQSTRPNQPTRQNSIIFTGNVSQVKPIQGGACAISLAFNEGSMANGQWEQKDTLFIEAYFPAKLNCIPNIGDKMTVSGFMASSNYQPQQGKKRFGMKIVVNEITEYTAKSTNQSAPQHAPQGQYDNAPQQRSHAPQGQYDNAPQQRSHAPQGQYDNAPQQRSHAPQGQYDNAPQQRSHAQQGQYDNAPQQNNSVPNNSFQRGSGFQN